MLRAVAVPFALLLCAAPAAAQQPRYKLESTDRQKVTATLTYELRTTDFAVSKWMIFLPEPPELPSQSAVKTTASPVGKVVAEKSDLARKVRYIEIPVARPKAGGGVALKLEVEAVLRARKLVPLAPNEAPPEVAPLTATERRGYLAATTNIDHDAGAFREWLDAKELRRTRGESELDLAARVLETIRADFRYKYDPDQEKRASVACRLKTTDCGGMSYLFVAALRANGVPARLLVGRYARPPKPGTKPPEAEYLQGHISTEFFAAGIGWVPVDPTFVNGSRGPVRDFVGRDPGDLLVLHVDPDLRLPFPDKDRESQWLQFAPAYWTTGKGTFDGQFGPTTWDVKAEPIKK